MPVLLAVVASALTGVLPPTGASGRTSPPPPRRVVVAAVPVGSTALDTARATLPIRASRAAEVPVTAPPDRGSRARSTDAIWAALARCESSGNPKAVGGGGRYFGAFQFSLGTWRSVGGTGNPTDHSYAVQLEAAKRLQARSGWSQWPACARRLGLR